MRKVLVLDANQRASLAIIRSLGRHGITVVAADREARTLGAASKYAAVSVCYPDPATSPGPFVSEIMSLADQLAIDTIVPATDLTTMLLVSQPALSNLARLAAPTAASYEALTDKRRLVELACRLGISVPATQIADTEATIVDAAHSIGFPAVLKPARSRYLKDGKVHSTSVQIVSDASVLTKILRNQDWIRDVPCLVQRFVPGHGAGIFALYGPSGPIAWFAHRRIREKPPWGGVSVLSESVPPDLGMQSAAAALLSAASWTGVAMVEFRVAEDRTPYLIEVNGRFWGSLQLAVDCGVDFPWLLYQLSQGISTAQHQSYSTGKRLRWLLGDLDSLLIELRRTRHASKLKRHAIADFFASFMDSTCRQEILRLHDLGPGIHEFWHWTKSLLIAR